MREIISTDTIFRIEKLIQKQFSKQKQKEENELFVRSILQNELLIKIDSL
jgi:hypothetical protein